MLGLVWVRTFSKPLNIAERDCGFLCYKSSSCLILVSGVLWCEMLYTSVNLSVCFCLSLMASRDRPEVNPATAAAMLLLCYCWCGAAGCCDWWWWWWWWWWIASCLNSPCMRCCVGYRGRSPFRRRGRRPHGPLSAQGASQPSVMLPRGLRPSRSVDWSTIGRGEACLDAGTHVPV